MLAIVLFCLWLVAANVLAMLPSRDHHWTNAYYLIGIGVPLLAYLTWQVGPIAGLIGLLAARSELRWPEIYLGRWMRQRVSRLGGLPWWRGTCSCPTRPIFPRPAVG